MLERLKRLMDDFRTRATAGETIPETVGAPGLAPCPDTPNCVSSKAPDAAHYVEPLTWSRDGRSAIEAASRVVKRESGAEVLDRQVDYLHASFRIPVFGFVDDVEFLWDEDEGVLHVRSASRQGRSDLGVNRRRVERLRRRIARAPR